VLEKGLAHDLVVEVVLSAYTASSGLDSEAPIVESVSGSLGDVDEEKVFGRLRAETRGRKGPFSSGSLHQ
jgi:hypothetical protein